MESELAFVLEGSVAQVADENTFRVFVVVRVTGRGFEGRVHGEVLFQFPLRREAFQAENA